MTLVMIATFYLYAGGAVAVVFLLFGLGQLDENAQGAWVFRPLLIPGVLLIWPLVIWRWMVLHRGEQKLDRHGEEYSPSREKPIRAGSAP